jgi:tetratricopeptide (TPR) repeat protein
VGRFKEAVDCYQLDIVICREVGDRPGAAMALDDLGRAYQGLRQLEDAIASYLQSLAMKREVGDPHGEGRTLTNLGRAYQEQHRFDEAIGCYQQALASVRATGDRHGEGVALDGLGGAYQEMRQPDRAAACWLEAAAAMRAVGDHEQTARLDQLAANAQARQRRWWQRIVKLPATRAYPRPGPIRDPGLSETRASAARVRNARVASSSR